MSIKVTLSLQERTINKLMYAERKKKGTVLERHVEEAKILTEAFKEIEEKVKLEHDKMLKVALEKLRVAEADREMAFQQLKLSHEDSRELRNKLRETEHELSATTQRLMSMEGKAILLSAAINQG